jgi:hypothetical protein
MLAMRSSRLWCLNRQSIVFQKEQTSTSIQNISTKMRYSQLVRAGINRSTIKGTPPQQIIVPLRN